MERLGAVNSFVESQAPVTYFISNQPLIDELKIHNPKDALIIPKRGLSVHRVEVRGK